MEGPCFMMKGGQSCKISLIFPPKSSMSNGTLERCCIVGPRLRQSPRPLVSCTSSERISGRLYHDHGNIETSSAVCIKLAHLSLGCRCTFSQLVPDRRQGGPVQCKGVDAVEWYCRPAVSWWLHWKHFFAAEVSQSFPVLELDFEGMIADPLTAVWEVASFMRLCISNTSAIQVCCCGFA